MANRKRPNYFQNRYNQWVIAGKIAVETGGIDPYWPDGTVAAPYDDGRGNVDYALVGQDYLYRLGIEIEEL